MESNRTEIFETMKDVIRLLATLLELGTLLNLKGVQLGEKYITKLFIVLYMDILYYWCNTKILSTLLIWYVQCSFYNK